MIVAAAEADWRHLAEPARSEALRERLANRLVGLSAVLSDSSAVVEYARRFGFADLYALIRQAARRIPEQAQQRTLFEALERFLRWRIDRLTIDPEEYPTEIANEFIPSLPPELAASWTTALQKSHGPLRLQKLSGPPTLGAVGHTGSVNQVAFSPTGDLFASASDDGSVRVCSVFAETPTAGCFGHPGKVTCVAFSPEGSRLASADATGIVNIWDPRAANCWPTALGT